MKGWLSELGWVGQGAFANESGPGDGEGRVETEWSSSGWGEIAGRPASASYDTATFAL